MRSIIRILQKFVEKLNLVSNSNILYHIDFCSAEMAAMIQDHYVTLLLRLNLQKYKFRTLDYIGDT